MTDRSWATPGPDTKEGSDARATPVEWLVGAEYPLVVVGGSVADQHRVADAVSIAAALNTDLLTVGDGLDVLPDGPATGPYLGPVDEYTDLIDHSRAVLFLGVGPDEAPQVPWDAFRAKVVGIKPTAGGVGFDCPRGTSPYLMSDLASIADGVERVAGGTEAKGVHLARGPTQFPPVEALSIPSKQRQMKRCTICHTLTNQVESVGSGYPGPRVEYHCPGASHRNHDRLETLLKRRENLDERKRWYGATTPQDRRARRRIAAERGRLTGQIETLREWFDGRFDDVTGHEEDTTGPWEDREFTPTDLDPWRDRDEGPSR